MIPQNDSKLLQIYQRLYDHLGPSHWWPGDSPLEIMVGAILTQNTSWDNVRKALERLKKEGALSMPALHEIREEVLAEWIRPSGYFRIKARRLKTFVDFLASEYQGRIELMQETPLESLREQLLALKGIGPETADSILLYALGKPTVVVDAYTHRIFFRHNLVEEAIGYEELRAFMMDHLPPDPALYNEYHALLVRLGKRYCRKNNPLCEACPLGAEA